MTRFFVIVFDEYSGQHDELLPTSFSKRGRLVSFLKQERLASKTFSFCHIFFYQIYSNVKSTPEWYHYCWLHYYVHISVLIWTGWKPRVSRQLLCELSGEGKWEIQLQSIERWTLRVPYFNEVDHSVLFIILYHFILIY